MGIVDGGWQLWSEWNKCPVTCGGSVQESQRSCDEPKPQFGGQPCTGSSKREQKCGTNPCPSMQIYFIYVQRICISRIFHVKLMENGQIGLDGVAVQSRAA